MTMLANHADELVALLTHAAPVALQANTRADIGDVATWNAANPDHLKGPDGKWADVPDVGAAAVSDKLKGAGRIDLEPGERLLRSDRIRGEFGRAWLASTEKDGRRSLRIGLGNDTFGTRHDHGGPWLAGPDRTAEINEERAELRERREDLENEIEDLEADPDADPAGLEARRAQLEEMYNADVDEVLPNGHTALLDEQGAMRLRETLAKALDDGEKLQAELDKPYQELDRLTLQRDKLKAIGRKWTDEEEAEWDRLTGEISRAESELDPHAGPVRPESGYWTLAEGSIPGQWADVHYDIYLDDPSVGAEVKLGAVPHGSEMDFSDLRDVEAAASFAAEEADQLVRMLAKMESGTEKLAATRSARARVRADVGSVAQWNAAHPDNLKGADGKWADVPGVSAADKLKLGKLAPAGFTVRSSRKVKTDGADIGIAEVDGPDGSQIRVGLITTESGKWDAGFSGEKRKAELREQLTAKQALFDSQDGPNDDLEVEIGELEDDLEALDDERTAILTPTVMADLRRQLSGGVEFAKANKAKQAATQTAYDALVEQIDGLAGEFSDPSLERQIRLGQGKVSSKKLRLRLLREDPDWADEVPRAEVDVADAERQLAPLLAQRAELMPPEARVQLEGWEREKIALAEGDIDDIITSAEVAAPNGSRVRAEIWGSDDQDSEWVTARLYVLRPGEARDDADDREDHASFRGLRGLNKLIAGFEFADEEKTTRHLLSRFERAAGPKATHAGLAVLAGDTSRVLMLQRALDDTDPAGGLWEMPGGSIEDGETPLDAAKREWSEETGCVLPLGEVTGEWRSGIYCGYVYSVADEAAVEVFGDRDDVTNPDDPSGDLTEALAWWEPNQLTGSNSALREELRQSVPKVLAALDGNMVRSAPQRAAWAGGDLGGLQRKFNPDQPRDQEGKFASKAGIARTGVLGGVLDKLAALREKLGDDDRSELDRVMDRLRGLESSDVDDDDLIEDEPDEEDDASDDIDALTMDSDVGELEFVAYADGDIDINWEEGDRSLRFSPTAQREVADAVAKFNILPVEPYPDMPDFGPPPDSITTDQAFFKWRGEKLKAWYESPEYMALSRPVAEMLTADGEYKVIRQANGNTAIGDPAVVDDLDSDGWDDVIQLSEGEQADKFVAMLREATEQAGPVVRATASPMRRMSGVADEHGNLHSPEDGKFVSKTGGVAGAAKAIGDWFRSPTYNKISTRGHIALDLVGLAPGFGEPFDLANAAWYLAERKPKNAFLSLGSAVPGFGYGTAAIKALKHIRTARALIDVRRTAKAAKVATAATRSAARLALGVPLDGGHDEQLLAEMRKRWGTDPRPWAVLHAHLTEQAGRQQADRITGRLFVAANGADALDGKAVRSSAAVAAASIVDCLAGHTYTRSQAQARTSWLDRAGVEAFQRFDEDQVRIPAGMPGGGRWVGTGKIVDKAGNLLGYTEEGLYREHGLTVHHIDLDDESGVSLFEGDTVLITSAMPNTHDNPDPDGVQLFHVASQDGSKELAEKIRRAEDEYSKLTDDEVEEHLEQRGDRANELAKLYDWDDTDEGVIVGYDPYEEGVVVYFPKPEVEDPRPDHLDEDYRPWALGGRQAIEMADALEEIAGFEPDELETYSAGGWDVRLWDDFDVSVTDDGENWAATFTRRIAEQLHAALAKLGDEGAGKAGGPESTRRVGPFTVTSAADGTVAVVHSFDSGHSFTIAAGDLDEMVEALDEATDLARRTGGYDDDWDTGDERAQPGQLTRAAVSIVDSLIGGAYTPEQRHARGGWLRWSKEQFAQAVAESKVGRDSKGKFAKKGAAGSSLKTSWADRIASGIMSETRLSDDSNASHVDLVQFGDGSRAVVKVSKSDSRSAEAELDAEELGAMVAKSLRLRPPDIYRSDDEEAYFSYVHDTAPNAAVLADVGVDRINLDSLDAKRIGLLDTLIENSDRNPGNTFAENPDDPGTRLIPIDHGQGWAATREGGDPTDVPYPQPFQRYLAQPSPRTAWLDNDLSPAYLKALRPKLEGLRPEFDQRGRGDWLDRTLTRLDIVASHAKGTVKL